MQSITTNQTNKEIEDFIEGDYITISEGQSRVLEFDINKVMLVEKTDFNGNPVKNVQFLVVDPQDEQQREKFELSKKHAPKLYNELKKGKTVLEVFRTGLAKQTEYHVKDKITTESCALLVFIYPLLLPCYYEMQIQ